MDGPRLSSLVFLKHMFFYSYTTQLTLSSFSYLFFTTVSKMFLDKQASDTWELDTVSFNIVSFSDAFLKISAHMAYEYDEVFPIR